LLSPDVAIPALIDELQTSRSDSGRRSAAANLVNFGLSARPWRASVLALTGDPDAVVAERIRVLLEALER
jgi:hypothetical protein